MLSPIHVLLFFGFSFGSYVIGQPNANRGGNEAVRAQSYSTRADPQIQSVAMLRRPVTLVGSGARVYQEALHFSTDAGNYMLRHSFSDHGLSQNDPSSSSTKLDAVETHHAGGAPRASVAETIQVSINGVGWEHGPSYSVTGWSVRKAEAATDRIMNGATEMPKTNISNFAVAGLWREFGINGAGW